MLHTIWKRWHWNHQMLALCVQPGILTRLSLLTASIYWSMWNVSVFPAAAVAPATGTVPNTRVPLAADEHQPVPLWWICMVYIVDLYAKMSVPSCILILQCNSAKVNALLSGNLLQTHLRYWRQIAPCSLWACCFASLLQSDSMTMWCHCQTPPAKMDSQNSHQGH